jgi:hypothetical protein
MILLPLLGYYVILLPLYARERCCCYCFVILATIFSREHQTFVILLPL